MYSAMAEEVERLQKSTIKDMKKELEERGVNFSSFLEKAEFVQALAEARVKGVTKQSAASSSSSSSSSARTEPPKSDPKKQETIAQAKKAMEEIRAMSLEELLAELKKFKVDTLSFRTKEDFEKALARERGIDLVQLRRAEAENDPEYRTVEVKRMPKQGGASQQQGGPQGGGGAGGPRGAAGGGADPFSSIFNQAGGGGASGFGGAGGSGFGGAGGFSSIFDMMNQQGGGGGFGGGGRGFNPRGGGRGGGAGVGGLSPDKLQKIMSNPQYAAAFSKAQRNSRIMAAVEEVARSPTAFDKYKNDPDVYDVLKVLRPVLR